MKRLAILGSTGSIGTQTLDVVARFPQRFEVVALAAGRNLDLLCEQVQRFRPRLVSVADPESVARLRERLRSTGVECSADPCEVASAGADLVVAAQVGSVGLEPVLAALGVGSDVALANKEVLVMAGEVVLRAARRSGARLLPLDSEHVAIAQCLAGHPRSAVKRIVLTASGGPFRERTLGDLARARPADALAHPNWDMGPKISIDSATLMNKGFEWIEARWLFDLPPDRIDVVIHPESIVHSLVEFSDGSWLAQLGVPDMRIPIAYTLGLPDRLPLADLAGMSLPPLDLVKRAALRFEAPDPERFPALRLAQAALDLGGAAPAALNAGNEVAVGAFLAERIPFTAIAEVAEETLRAYDPSAELDPVRSDRAGASDRTGPDLAALATVWRADRQARAAAREYIERRYA